MGLNISGLVIDKNYENNLTELESILGEKLVFEKEVAFEEATENWKEDSYCDVYFSENGTFVLLSMEVGGFEFYGKNQTAFSFVLSEMTMVFTVNYTKNNELVRTITETEDMHENEGVPFDFEKDEDDTSELIYHLIENTLGESFYDIDLEATCFRYTFKQDDSASDSPETNNRDASSPASKPWWKFW